VADDNKRKLHYFEAQSMPALYNALDSWQEEHRQRFLSLNVEHDTVKFCCIALTNPTEVIIVDGSSYERAVGVTFGGSLQVKQSLT
jgi:hypothetical protein